MKLRWMVSSAILMKPHILKRFLHQIGLPCLEAPLVPQKYLLVLLCAFLLQIRACSDIVSRAFSIAVTESFHRTLSHTRLVDTLHVGPATLRGLRPVCNCTRRDSRPVGANLGKAHLVKTWSSPTPHLSAITIILWPPSHYVTDIICERPLTSGSRNQFVSNTFSLFPTTNQIAERERNFFSLGTICQTFSGDDKYLFRTAHHKVDGVWMATWESPNLSW